jgi:hypothetical protein
MDGFDWVHPISLERVRGALFVDDGSDNVTGALPSTLASLARSHGIRYELMRYPVSVGFTMATSEAARRANGKPPLLFRQRRLHTTLHTSLHTFIHTPLQLLFTHTRHIPPVTGTYLLFLNNDAFMRRHALRALLDAFATHADLGVVGAKLVGTDDTLQEAGAIVWADASGAWFNKYAPLYRGKRNEFANHRINYVRETDYVSAAVAMVPRRTFVAADMFDVHFSPGYYEDTDLSFTMRARGLRVLYTPFAHVVHMAHSTYQSSMDALLERNQQQVRPTHPPAPTRPRAMRVFTCRSRRGAKHASAGSGATPNGNRVCRLCRVLRSSHPNGNRSCSGTCRRATRRPRASRPTKPCTRTWRRRECTRTVCCGWI